MNEDLQDNGYDGDPIDPEAERWLFDEYLNGDRPSFYVGQVLELGDLRLWTLTNIEILNDGALCQYYGKPYHDEHYEIFRSLAMDPDKICGTKFNNWYPDKYPGSMHYCCREPNHEGTCVCHCGCPNTIPPEKVEEIKRKIAEYEKELE